MEEGTGKGWWRPSNKAKQNTEKPLPGGIWLWKYDKILFLLLVKSVLLLTQEPD